MFNKIELSARNLTSNNEELLEAIEALDCRYLIKAKDYPTLVAQVTDPDIV